MKHERKYKEIRFTTETFQLPDETWKSEARVFLTAKGVEIASLGGFDTEHEAENDTTQEVKWLIDFSLRKNLPRYAVGATSLK